LEILPFGVTYGGKFLPRRGVRSSYKRSLFDKYNVLESLYFVNEEIILFLVLIKILEVLPFGVNCTPKG
jgi:hypothetical protein